MKKIFLITATIVITLTNAQVQEVVGSSGDYFENSNAQLSWTLGEISVETYNNGNNILTQGFHQTNLIPTKIPEDYLNNTGAEVNIYPNPATEYVKIEISNADASDYFYEFTDNKGKILSKKNFTSETENISFSNYASGVYYIRILEKSGKYTDTYKIVKTDK